MSAFASVKIESTRGVPPSRWSEGGASPQKILKKFMIPVDAF